MAASHAIDLLKDIVVGTSTTGLYDENNNKISAIDITTQSGLYGYSQTYELSPKSIEHVLTALCEGCTIDVLLQISPDGKNWTDCVLSTGERCEFLPCSAAAGDCDVKHIDVPMLQFLRVKIGNAGAVGGVCTIKINFTLN